MGTVMTYFSDMHIPPTSMYVSIGIGVAAAFLVVGLLAPLGVWMTHRRWPRRHVRYEKLILSLAGVGRAMGLVLLLLYFLRYEAIFPFTNRSWVTVAVLITILWSIVAARKYQQFVPVIQKSDQLHEQFGRYLPRQKVRK